MLCCVACYGGLYRNMMECVELSYALFCAMLISYAVVSRVLLCGAVFCVA